MYIGAILLRYCMDRHEGNALKVFSLRQSLMRFLCQTEGSQPVSNGLAEVLLLTAQPELRSRGFPGGCMPSFPGYLSPWKESARGICAKPVSNTEQTPTGKAKE